MDDIMWVDLIMQLLVTTLCMCLIFYFGYLWGWRKGYRQRLEDMRENAQHVASRAKADLDVLNAASPPRQRTARIKGTSRRATEG